LRSKNISRIFGENKKAQRTRLSFL